MRNFSETDKFYCAESLLSHNLLTKALKKFWVSGDFCVA